MEESDLLHTERVTASLVTKTHTDSQTEYQEHDLDTTELMLTRGRESGRYRVGLRFERNGDTVKIVMPLREVTAIVSILDEKEMLNGYRRAVSK